MPRNLLTQSVAISSPPADSSLLSNMPPWMIPFMHSYSSDIARVVRISDVRGGSSLRTSRGSKGVRVANLISVRDDDY